MTHLLTTSDNSLSFSSPTFCCLSVQFESLPRNIGFSNLKYNIYMYMIMMYRPTFLNIISIFIAKIIKNDIHASVYYKKLHLFLNSAEVPRIPSLTKCTRLKYSSRSFWIGVPDRSTRLLHWILVSAQ